MLLLRHRFLISLAVIGGRACYSNDLSVSALIVTTQEPQG